MDILHTVLKDRYCILEQIGKGGSGTVYLAKDMNLGVLRAVKEIPSDCRKEADMMLKLSHPLLPGVADYVEDGERCYIIMEYIKGKSLGQYLKEGKIFTISDIMKIGTEAADILVYLHSRKPPVYYGDLKPDNLILNEDGRIYLVDLEVQYEVMGKEAGSAQERENLQHRSSLRDTSVSSVTSTIWEKHYRLFLEKENIF